MRRIQRHSGAGQPTGSPRRDGVWAVLRRRPEGSAPWHGALPADPGEGPPAPTILSPHIRREAR